MTIYDIQVVMLLLLIAISQSTDNVETKKCCFSLGVLLLGIVLFFRTYRIGSDLGAYHVHYDRCGSMSIPEILQYYKMNNIGFYIYNHLFYRITNGNYQIFISFTALITLVPVIRLILKSVGYSNYSLFVYVCFGYYAFQFSGLKQALATAMLTFAYMSIVKKRRTSFIFWVLIGSLFHIPCLIFLPAYFIAHKKPDALFAITSVIIVAIIFVMRGQIVNRFQDDYRSVVDLNGSIAAGGKVLLIALIVGFGFLFCLPRDFSTNEIVILWRFMIVSAILQTFANFGNVFERLADYYFFFTIIYIPRLITVQMYDTEESNIEARIILDKNNQYLVVMLITLALLGYYCVYNRNIPGLNPYSTWLN